MTNGEMQGYPPQGYPPQGPPPAAMPQPESSSPLPMIGGILLIIGALAGLFYWIYYSIVMAEVAGAMSMLLGDDASTIFLIIGIVGIIASLVAALGGVFALMKKSWGLALTGSILGILFCGGFWCLGSLMAIAAMILIIVSKKHFK